MPASLPAVSSNLEMRTPADTDSAHSWHHSTSAAAPPLENSAPPMRCPSSVDSLALARSVQFLFAKPSAASTARQQLLPASQRNLQGWPPFSRMLPLFRVARPFLRNSPPEAAASLSCSDLSPSTRSPLPTSSARSAPAGTKSPLLPTPDLHTENPERTRRILPKMPLV